MLRLIEAPTESALSLADAKAHLKVDLDDDDHLIASLITAITAHLDGADGILGRTLAPQTWELVEHAFPPTALSVPLPPLIEIESIKYLDPAREEQTLAPDKYRVIDGGWGRALIIPAYDAGWPATASELDAVRIRFRCGYQNASSPPRLAVPEPIIQAMKLMLSDYYDQRGSVVVGAAVSRIPEAAERLLLPYRIIPVA